MTRPPTASPQEQELAQEQEQEQHHEPEPEPAAEMVPECVVPELMLGAAAVLERMARMVAAAKAAPASPMMMSYYIEGSYYLTFQFFHATEVTAKIGGNSPLQ